MRTSNKPLLAHLAAALAFVTVTIAALLAVTASFVPANASPVSASTVTTSTPGTAVAALPGLLSAQLPGVVGTAEEPDQGGPQGPRGPQGNDNTINIELDGLTDKPSTPVITILLLTLLAVAPSILLTCTSFTKILVVLSLTRNALGLQQTPPNQVLAGLALFLSLFIMAPTLSAVYEAGLQPFLSGDKTAAASYESGVEPLREFMVKHTDSDELELLTNVANRDLPANPDEVSMATLVPAFILTELKQAFIIGFIIFIPFLVIDIVVAGALMALGMMMMPPSIVSLPFKLLLFVLVNGWGLIITALVGSYA